MPIPKRWYIKCLRHENRIVRINAAQNLVNFPDQSTIMHLKRALNTRNNIEKTAIVKALSEINSEECIETLIKRVKMLPDYPSSDYYYGGEKRYEGLHIALEKNPHPKIKNMVLDILRNPHSSIQSKAVATYLAKEYEHEAIIEQLKNVVGICRKNGTLTDNDNAESGQHSESSVEINDEDGINEISIHAWDSLAKLGIQEILEPLVKKYWNTPYDPNRPYSWKYDSVYLLGELGAKEAEAVFFDAMEHESMEIRSVGIYSYVRTFENPNMCHLLRALGGSIENFSAFLEWAKEFSKREAKTIQSYIFDQDRLVRKGAIILTKFAKNEKAFDDLAKLYLDSRQEEKTQIIKTICEINSEKAINWVLNQIEKRISCNKRLKEPPKMTSTRDFGLVVEAELIKSLKIPKSPNISFLENLQKILKLSKVNTSFALFVVEKAAEAYWNWKKSTKLEKKMIFRIFHDFKSSLEGLKPRVFEGSLKSEENGSFIKSLVYFSGLEDTMALIRENIALDRFYTSDLVDLVQLMEKEAIESFLWNSNREIKKIAMKTLQERGWKPSNKHLFLQTAQIQGNICDLLYFKDEAGEFFFQLFQETSNRKEQELCAKILGDIRYNRPEAIVALSESLMGDSYLYHDYDMPVRRECAESLGKIGNKAAIPALLTALADKQSEVVVEARDAIKNMTKNYSDLLCEYIKNISDNKITPYLISEYYKEENMISEDMAYLLIESLIDSDMENVSNALSVIEEVNLLKNPGENFKDQTISNLFSCLIRTLDRITSIKSNSCSINALIEGFNSALNLILENNYEEKSNTIVLSILLRFATEQPFKVSEQIQRKIARIIEKIQPEKLPPKYQEVLSNRENQEGLFDDFF